MAEYDNTNRGALFDNDKGDNPKRPDMTGSLNIEGTDYRLSVWKREAKSGRTFLSISAEVAQKQNGAAAPAQQPQQQSLNDEIPF
jgi:hypothetical protein